MNNKREKTMRQFSKEVREITMWDRTNYDPDNCNDGGHYGFWTTFRRLSEGKWEVSYGTTADLPFCPCCGQFEEHYDPYDSDSQYSCGDFEVLTDEEVFKRLDSFQASDDDPDKYIVFSGK